MQKQIVKMDKCVWLVAMTQQELFKFADVVCGVCVCHYHNASDRLHKSHWL